MVGLNDVVKGHESDSISLVLRKISPRSFRAKSRSDGTHVT